MSHYRKKPVVIEAITFDELVAHGLANGANVVNGMPWSFQYKGQPVTECDLAIDSFLSERLRAARPDYGWLSEETEDDPERCNASTVFIVDPIDGTVAFLKGRPHFTICVAVVENRRPQRGGFPSRRRPSCA